MNTIEAFNQAGRELKELLLLRFPTIAFKLIFDEDEIPEGSTVPLRDTGKHVAMCQAFAMARRNRSSLTLFKEDNWCVWPNACFKFCPLDEDDVNYVGRMLFMKDQEKSLKFFKEKYPWLDTGKYDKPPVGYAIAPLDTCNFIPDVVVIYCRVSQLRTLIMATKMQDGDVFDVMPDTIVSCCYATIPLLNGKKYNIAIPDPGEYERSLVDEDEIIFSSRADALPDLMEGLKGLDAMRFGYPHLKYDMNLDYPRAEFYNMLSSKWGLDVGETWTH
jgi:uncharacterized protein (DUF169 family)